MAALKIKEFYRNKNILITGGTGFIGLGTVEKLLRSFPDVGDIYIIARPSQGQTFKERREDFVKNSVFNSIHKQNKQISEIVNKKVDFSKVKFIQGDLTKVNFGLSREIITKLQEKVNMIIHSGATVKFNVPLKEAILCNVFPTFDLLEMAKGCKNIDCFVHVSTTYIKARKHIKHVDETVLPHPISPGELLQLSNRLTAHEFNARSKELMFDWPNTYSYTKNVAENLCEAHKGHFPLVIFRPGVVTPSYKDPSPYWTGNKMGFTRVLLEAHRGLAFHAHPEANCNCVPVDLTINGMLMAAYTTATYKTNNGFNVFNFSTNNNPFEFVKAFEHFVKNVNNYKELKDLRKKLMKMTAVKPGSKEEKMINMIKNYENFENTVLYFLNTPLTYSNDSMDALWEKMADDERHLLPFSVNNCNWEEYFSGMNGNLFGTQFNIGFDDI